MQVQQQSKSGKQIARVLNLAGPDTHIVAVSAVSRSVQLQESQLIKLTDSSSKDAAGTGKRHSEDMSPSNNPVVVHCNNIGAMLEGGQKFVTDCGCMDFEVVSKDTAHQSIQLRVMTAGVLSAGQQIHSVRGVDQEGASQLTAADAKAVQEFVSRHLIEYVAASVRSLADVVSLRQALDRIEGKQIQILARVEDVKALPDLDTLLQQVRTKLPEAMP